MLRRLLIPVFLLLCACTPTLDWREVRPEGSAVHALFPCKPTAEIRTVVLVGAPTRMTMAVCRAGGNAYVLAFADAGEPGRVTPTLAAWRDAAVANLGVAAPVVVGPLQVRGMTPHPLAQRVRVAGKAPDGSLLAQEAGFFSKGTRVFQASVMGPRPDQEATDTFFENLSLLP